MELVIIAGIFCLSLVCVVAIVAGVWFRGTAGPEGLTVEMKKK